MMGDMMGKLTPDALPLHQPIIMGAVGFMILCGLAVAALITYFGFWG